MDGCIAIAKAFSDENRVRILLALKDRELCGCQLIALIGLAPSTISKHMTILRHAELVHIRKTGRWVFYRLAGDHADPAPSRMVSEAIDWLINATRASQRIQDDAVRLKRILACDPDTFCKRMTGG